MANYVISKIQINDDVLELKDATARNNINALNSATTQNTTKITNLEGTTSQNTSSINTLNGEVANIKQAIENSDHYNISVDSETEMLIFTK